MGEKKESKLQHVIKISWESEQMPGWEDSLSMVLETTKKEFQIKNKDIIQNNMQINILEQESTVIEEEFSM